jgi:YHS domain-containing protein
MNKVASLLPLLAVVACHQPATRPAQAVQMQTIDSVDMRRTAVDPPPTLTDVGPAPKPKPNQQSNAHPLDARDEAVRAALPFVPAIAMDPVDGSKISIRADTPTLELKGHIYYFSSAENKAKFVADPQSYLKGPFSHL